MKNIKFKSFIKIVLLILLLLFFTKTYSYANETKIVQDPEKGGNNYILYLGGSSGSPLNLNDSKIDLGEENSINLTIINTTGAALYLYADNGNGSSYLKPEPEGGERRIGLSKNKEEQTEISIEFLGEKRILNMQWYSQSDYRQYGRANIEVETTQQGYNREALEKECEKYTKLEIQELSWEDLKKWYEDIDHFIDQYRYALTDMEKINEIDEIRIKIAKRIEELEIEIPEVGNGLAELKEIDEDKYQLILGQSDIEVDKRTSFDYLTFDVYNPSDIKWYVEFETLYGVVSTYKFNGKGHIERKIDISSSNYVIIRWSVEGGTIFKCRIDITRESGLTPFDEAELNSVIELLRKYMAWYSDKEKNLDSLKTIEDLQKKGREIRVEKENNKDKIIKFREILLQRGLDINILDKCINVINKRIQVKEYEQQSHDPDSVINTAKNYVNVENPPITLDGIADNVVAIGRTAIAIGSVILMVVTMVMGIKYITADAQSKGKLKSQLVGLVIATCIVFGAYVIWNFMYNLAVNVF